MAIVLLVFVMLLGPTLSISRSDKPTNICQLSDELFAVIILVRVRDDAEWYQNWTIFYWAWWISWSPFVGMFIARISKDGTIRQFLAAVLVMPVGVSVFWFSVFGTTAIDQAQNGVGQLADGFTDASLVLFQMLEYLADDTDRLRFRGQPASSWCSSFLLHHRIRDRWSSIQ